MCIKKEYGNKKRKNGFPSQQCIISLIIFDIVCIINIIIGIYILADSYIASDKCLQQYENKKEGGEDINCKNH